MRVASLTPSNTEIVAFLGCMDELVAVDTFSDWPPGVEALEDLGPDLQIDVEKLAGLGVDVVLASASVPGMERIVAECEAAGLDPVVLAPKSLDDVGRDIRTVAGVLGVKKRGEVLAEAFVDGIASVREATRGAERVSVAWEWWPNPPIVAGGEGWMSEVIGAAGGVNVFDGRREESFETSVDEVLKAAPDRYALCWQGTLARVQDPDRLRSREGWGAVSAVRKGRILDCPEALFGRPGPRLVEGVHRLALALHPELEEGLPGAYAWLPDAWDVTAALGLTG